MPQLRCYLVLEIFIKMFFYIDGLTAHCLRYLIYSFYEIQDVEGESYIIIDNKKLLLPDHGTDGVDQRSARGDPRD